MAAIAFPPNPVEDQLFEDSQGRGWVFKNGSWVSKATEFGPNTTISLKLESYDLKTAITPGGNLQDQQVYLVNNTSGGAKAIAFTNPPAGRAMTIIIKVTGNAGALSLPAGTVFAEGVDTKLSTKTTFFIMFWDGATFTATANIKT